MQLDSALRSWYFTDIIASRRLERFQPEVIKIPVVITPPLVVNGDYNVFIALVYPDNPSKFPVP